jgi:hypothetical protein
MTPIGVTDILSMMRKWEARLIRIGVHDNMVCQYLWLELHLDGSGAIMAEYRKASEYEDSAQKFSRVMWASEKVELFGFKTLEELHGDLVARTMEIR